VRNAAACVSAFVLALPAWAAPRPGLWVAYQPRIAHSSAAPDASGDVTISHGHGAGPIFAVRLLGAPRGLRIGAEFLSPANYDANALHVRDVESDDPGDDPSEQAEYDFERLRTALHHHRPPVPIRVDGAGTAQILWTPALRRHAACARRLLRGAMARGLAVAEERDLSWWRYRERRPSRLSVPRIDAAGTLLRLVALDLPDVADGRWSRLERQAAAEEDEGSRRRPPNQWQWRSTQIRAAGQEFALEIDLIRDRSSAGARLCRTIRLDGISNRTSDRCEVSGFLDRRDGWPIVISFGRTMRGSGGSRWRGTTYYRLAPLEGFVAPENPCPS
jgi:hypothetical protein